MAKRKVYLTARLPDGYVKTIGPTALALTHYWRVVAVLASGKTEVFWGHSKSLAEAKRTQNLAVEAAATRGWKSHHVDIVAVERTETPIAG
ncbi:hypothetical protein [Sphingomonas sp. Leaf38]|jgi:hypothetical protein|uniref:hypothetical protein n=1 Tax=Sphingomonas sp. Leaf38 TaxID=1736217 RepID=UPI0006FBEE59|nr:hypothetical protein [Sphingomonas sp. Leaf38]KQN29174.1 hypothetical protein ASE88_09435 [Sphingomonas sp. Leaf38]